MRSPTSESWRFPVLRVLVALALLSTPAFTDEVEETKLVAHEWGVLTVGHPGGIPVLGAADHYLESLPNFVIRNDLAAASRLIHQREGLMIWKPVIHLYGHEGQKVEVTVRVASGYPIVYFPNPKLAGFSTSTGRGLLTWSQAMAWNFSLTKERPSSLLAPPVDHWWNAAREIPGDYVIMEDGSGCERFLFSRGTTIEKPSVTAAVSENSIVVSNRDSAESAPVILILNDHGSQSGVYLDSVAAGKTVTLTSDSFELWEKETLVARCRKQWEVCGMTSEEAIGIVESWKNELFNTPGFLLISRIPEPVYETIFPIEIKPAPSELKRACLVFDTLAGQYARKHWIPELAAESGSLFAQLSDPDFRTRVGAREKLIAHGEIMVPFLQDLIARPDAELEAKQIATSIMGLLTESPVCKIPEPDLNLNRLHDLDLKRP